MASASSYALDTTPRFPKPDGARIRAAKCGIPAVFENVRPNGIGEQASRAASIANELNQQGHTLAAAHWAIHEAVVEGYLIARFRSWGGVINAPIDGAGICERMAPSLPARREVAETPRTVSQIEYRPEYTAFEVVATAKLPELATTVEPESDERTQPVIDISVKAQDAEKRVDEVVQRHRAAGGVSTLRVGVTDDGPRGHAGSRDEN